MTPGKNEGVPPHTMQSTNRLQFAEITSPGSYVFHETGDLCRVPEDALVAGRSPLIDFVSKTPKMVTKISDDPWIPVSKARQLASDADLFIDF